MDYPTVSTELFTWGVMDQIRYNQFVHDPSPAQAIKTIQFAQSAFYSLYGDHWDRFIELRDKVNIEFNSPDSLVLVDDTVVFSISTNAVTPESLAILKVYLDANGWETMVVTQKGIYSIKIMGKFTSADNYEFVLTPKRGQPE